MNGIELSAEDASHLRNEAVCLRHVPRSLAATNLLQSLNESAERALEVQDGFSASVTRALGFHFLRFDAGGPCLRQGRKVPRRALAMSARGKEGIESAIKIHMKRMHQAIRIGIDARQLDAAVLQAMHQAMLVGTPFAGRFRNQPSWLGQSPQAASFVPPKPESVPGLIDDLVDFVENGSLQPLAVAALAHAQLINIHPFFDGNGRLARALTQVILRRRNDELSIVPPISSCLAFTPTPYSKAHAEFRAGRPERWLHLFLAASERAINMIAEAAPEVAACEFNTLGLGGKTAHVWRRMWKLLLLNPVMSTKELAQSTKMRESVVLHALRSLNKQRCIHRLPGAGLKQRWEYSPMLKLLSTTDQFLFALS